MNALIIVDVQNDFCQGGSLEVLNSNEIIPIINHITQNFGDKFYKVCLTKDFHPQDHISFIGSDCLNKLNSIQLDELTNKWKDKFPPHCVKGTLGAEIHKDIVIKGNENIFEKGTNAYKEEFSGFCNPNLFNFLNENAIKNLFVLGLAYDFCVRYTAVDGNKNGFKTFVIKDACRGISGETIKETEIEFSNLGITIINSLDLEKYL